MSHNPCGLKLGCYFLANDRVLDWTLAFLNSFRRFNPRLPLLLIPFDPRITELRALAASFDFAILPEDRLERWDSYGAEFTDRVAQQRMFRKLAAFEGSFDAWLYFDADCIVLDDVEPLLESLARSSPSLLYYDDDGVFDFVYADPGLARRMRREYGAVAFNAGLFGVSGARGIVARLADAAALAREIRDGVWQSGWDQVFLSVLLDVSGARKLSLSEVAGRRALAGVASNPRIWRDSPMERACGQVAPGYYVPFLHWAGYSSPYDAGPFRLWTTFRHPAASEAQRSALALSGLAQRKASQLLTRAGRLVRRFSRTRRPSKG